MIFNTQQLQYLIEIERTRSISQAAANLYVGQPNLSRLLKDTEENLGFPIFERTRKGVRPTEKGVQFLAHARNMLRELDYIERLGPNSNTPNRFRICLPRSFFWLEKVRSFISGLDQQTGLDGMIRECHPRQALELIDSGMAEIAVIRYSLEYQDYFQEQAEARNLSMHILSRESFSLVFSNSSPLAGLELIYKNDLAGYTELMHRDAFYPLVPGTASRIYTVDRMAQLQLLQKLPESYLWSEQLPARYLERNGLLQRTCADGTSVYQNALVYKPQCAMSQIERDFIRMIEEGTTAI